MDKSPDAFRTISEVAEDLDLPQHVLRFWETRFAQIRPLKRGGGRRYYRPDDVDLLRGIRHLLYDEGYTIKGVQRILKEQGVRFVMQVWRGDTMTLQPEPVEAVPGPAEHAPAPPAPRSAPVTVAPMRPVRSEPDPISRPQPSELVPPPDEPLPRGVLPDEAPARDASHRSGFRFMERFLGDKYEIRDGQLSKDDIRRLQATLFELLECKRILDQAR